MVQRGQFEYTRRQFPRRQLPQMPLDGWAQVAGRIREGHGFATEADPCGLRVDVDFQAHPFSPKEYFRPGRPGYGPGWPQGLPQKLFLKPGNIPLGELLCFRERSAARNSHAGGAVRTEAQDVAPRPPVADEPQPDGPPAGQQPVVLGLGGLLAPKEPFELHMLI
jgi:hypothetical protein